MLEADYDECSDQAINQIEKELETLYEIDGYQFLIADSLVLLVSLVFAIFLLT